MELDASTNLQVPEQRTKQERHGGFQLARRGEPSRSIEQIFW
jgi:hypothetical protein